MITAEMIDGRSSGIQDALERKGAPFSIKSMTCFKNNISKGGISIDSGAPICPVIYPSDQIWSMSDDEVADYLIDVEDDVAKDAPDLDVNEIISRENIISKVLPRLYGESNRIQLEANDRAYLQFIDMLIGFYVPLEITADGISSINVTGAMLMQADITLDELHEAALENIRDRYRIQSMTEIISGFMGLNLDSDMAVPDMFVVSNEQYVQGSAAILSDKALAELAEMLGDEFVILPSSIHEVICIPAGMMEDAKEVGSIVREINAEHVRPEDRLTDSVYLYKEGSIQKVA